MGFFDTYCVICGLGIHKFKSWMDKLYILTNKNKIAKVTKNDDPNDVSEFNYKGTTYYCEKLNWHSNIEPGKMVDKKIPGVSKKIKELKFKDSENYGKIVHRDCYKLLEKIFKKSLIFGELVPFLDKTGYLKKGKYKELKKYVGLQDFSQSYVEIIKKHPLIGESPLKNKDNAKRIVFIWKDIMKKIKKMKLRPAPSEHASELKIGATGYGNDGNKYIVKKVGGVKKWVIKK